MGLFSRKKPTAEEITEFSETKTIQPLSVPEAPIKRLLSYQISNVQGIGTRSNQEDSFGFVNAVDVTKIRKNGFMAIVADGMGGMADGRFASDTAVSTLRAAFDSFDYEENIPEQLNAAMRRAGKIIYDNLEGEGGSTAIACLFYNGELYYSSVGDSFLMLKRDNQLLRLNRQQNVRNNMYYDEIRNGSTNILPANNAPQKAALTGFLGMQANDDIDGFKRALPLHNGDVIMICSDGVAGVLSEKCMLSCLSCETPAEMCSELERCILELNLQSQDNYTALVIKCEY